MKLIALLILLTVPVMAGNRVTFFPNSGDVYICADSLTFTMLMNGECSKLGVRVEFPPDTVYFGATHKQTTVVHDTIYAERGIINEGATALGYGVLAAFVLFIVAWLWVTIEEWRDNRMRRKK